MSKSRIIEVENINIPGRLSYVNAEKYEAMRDVLLKVLPKDQPGLTEEEMCSAVLPYLPQNIWPNGEKSGWWVKVVQLDLEAKGLVMRIKGKPTRWNRS